MTYAPATEAQHQRMVARKVAARTPVENAFMTFMALSPSDRIAACRRFNDFAAAAQWPDRMNYTQGKEA